MCRVCRSVMGLRYCHGFVGLANQGAVPFLCAVFRGMRASPFRFRGLEHEKNSHPLLFSVGFLVLCRVCSSVLGVRFFVGFVVLSGCMRVSRLLCWWFLFCSCFVFFKFPPGPLYPLGFPCFQCFAHSHLVPSLLRALRVLFVSYMMSPTKLYRGASHMLQTG